VVSQAQADANAETARLEATLNRVNQQTPYGSVNYSNDGDVWTQTVTESDNQRRLREGQEQTGIALNDLGLSQIDTVQSILGQAFTPRRFDSQQATGGRLDLAQALGSYDASQFDPRSAPQMQLGQYDPTRTAAQYDPTRQAGLSFADMDPRANGLSLSDLNPRAGGLGLSDLDPRSRGLDFSDLNPREQGLNLSDLDPRAQGMQLGQYDPTQQLGRFNPTQTDPGALNLQAFNAGQVGAVNAGAYDPTQQLGNFGDDITRRAFEGATAGMDRSFARADEDLRSRLANQGITAGSDAFNAERSAFEEGRANAYASALMNAQQVGMMARGQAAGELGQGFNQARASYGDQVGALNQMAGLRQAERADQLGLRQADLANALAVRGQNVGEMAQGAGLTQAMSADQLARAGMAADFRGQMNADQLSRTGLEASLRGQQRADDLAATGMTADMRGQMNADQLARLNLEAGFRGQQRADSLAGMGMAADFRSQANADQLARAGQGFNQGLQASALGSQLAQAQNADALGRLRSAFDMSSQDRSRQLAEILAQRTQNLGEAEADYQRNYAADLAARQIPLQEIVSIMSGAPITPLNPAAPTATSVGQTNVLGAYQLNQQAQQAAYQAQMDQRAALVNALGSIGGSMMGGARPWFLGGG
jgi:hypothetical protein